MLPTDYNIIGPGFVVLAMRPGFFTTIILKSVV